jgi:hypothetical protein
MSDFFSAPARRERAARRFGARLARGRVAAASEAAAELGCGRDLVLEAAAACLGARDWNALSARLRAGGAWDADKAAALRRRLSAKSTTIVALTTGAGKTWSMLEALGALRGDGKVLSFADPVEFVLPRPVEDDSPLAFPAGGIVEAAPFDGGRFWFRVRGGRIETNLPLALVPANLAARCRTPAELALLAATLAVGGTLGQLRSKPHADGRLAEYGRKFARRFVGHRFPLAEGHEHGGDPAELWSWLRHEGVWWWRTAEDKPGTEYA